MGWVGGGVYEVNPPGPGLHSQNRLFFNKNQDHKAIMQKHNI